MDLGRRHRTGARSSQLVEPSFLAPRRRSPDGNATGSRGIGLGPLAGSGADASLQPGLPALFLARLVRLRLRLAGRYGLLQFRYHFPRHEAGGAIERAGELDGTPRRDLSARV